MAGRRGRRKGRKVNNIDRKVTTTDKSFKIVAKVTNNNTENTNLDLGNKRKRNENIKSNPQVVANNSEEFLPRKSSRIANRLLSKMKDPVTTRPEIPTFNIKPTKSLSKQTSLFLSLQKFTGVDEDLDYEPDDVLFENEQNSKIPNSGNFSNDISSIRSESFSNDISSIRFENPRIHSRNTTISITNDLCKDGLNSNVDESLCSRTPEYAASTTSHRSDMLPYDRFLDKAQDGRQNHYLPFPLSNGLVSLDSSSDSTVLSATFSVDGEKNGDSDNSSEYQMTNEEEDKLLHSENEFSDEEYQEDSQRTSTPYLPSRNDTSPEKQENSVFQDSTVTMKGKNIIIRAVNLGIQKPQQNIWNTEDTNKRTVQNAEITDGRASSRLSVEDSGVPRPSSQISSVGRPNSRLSVEDSGVPRPSSQISSVGRPNSRLSVEDSGVPRPSSQISSVGRANSRLSVEDSEVPGPSSQIPSVGRPNSRQSIENTDLHKPCSQNTDNTVAKKANNTLSDTNVNKPLSQNTGNNRVWRASSYWTTDFQNPSNQNTVNTGVSKAKNTDIPKPQFIWNTTGAPKSAEMYGCIEDTDGRIQSFLNKAAEDINMRRELCKEAVTNKQLNEKVTQKPPRLWDQRFHPYKMTTVCLNDLGYVAPPVRSTSESGLDRRDDPNVISKNNIPEAVAQPTKFTITFGANQEKNISPNKEKTASPNRENFEQVPNSGESTSSGFKVPLPPAKRPPTRPRKASSSTSSPNRSLAGSTSDSSETSSREQYLREVNAKTTETIRQRDKEDDAISISASSVSHFDRIEQDFVADEYIKIEPDFDDTFANRWSLENWLNTSQQHANNSVGFLPPTHTFNPEFDISARKALASSIDFKSLDPFFNSLCFFHYLKEGKCFNPRCHHLHSVNESIFLKKCKELPTAKIQSLYIFTLDYPLLFSDLFPVFLKGFAYHKMQNSILQCIDHVFSLKLLDTDVAIEQIIKALMGTGLTFIEAVGKINLTIGPLRYPGLADYLLDILTLEPDITENWEEIKLICRSKTFIAPDIVMRIIKLVLNGPYSNNLHMQRDVYNTILKPEKTDISKLDADLLAPINLVMQFGTNSAGPPASNNCIERHRSLERQRSEQSTSGSSSNSPENFRNLLPVDSDLRTMSPSRMNRAPSAEQVRQQLRFSPPANNSSSSSTGSPYVPQVPGVTRLNVQASHPALPDYSVPPPPALIDTSVPPPTVVARIPQITVQVTSPSREINLCPEIPILGKFRYAKDFKFTESLHNLLASASSPSDQVQMHESHIVKLNEIILTANGTDFLQMLDNYKSPNTLQHFITMSIAHLKNCDQRPYNPFINLLESIGNVKPNFKRDPLLKGVIEVIVFNLLFYMERHCLWAEAKKLIETFCDWDSLLTSKLLQQFAISGKTPMGRYIFLAKLLAEAKGFYKVYEILTCPALCLLKPPETWPLFYVNHVDVESRNTVLAKFFKNAHKYNVEVVCDMYRSIFQFGDIWEFDSLSFFNPILEFLINNEKTSSLKHFLSDIDIFYKKMNKTVLRRFITTLESQLSMETKFKLYEMAVQKGIYMRYSGTEAVVLIRTDLQDNELKLIFQYYMHKMAQVHHMTNHDLKIMIRLPVDGSASQMGSIQTRSVDAVNEIIQEMLNDCFGISFRTPEQNVNSALIEISKDELRSIVDRC